MKKYLLSFIAIACLSMSLSGCPSPTTSPSSSPSPSTSVTPSVTPSSATVSGRHFASKADFIQYLNCLKIKVPSISSGLEIQIKAVTELDDAKWEKLKSSYEEVFSGYAAYNC